MGKYTWLTKLTDWLHSINGDPIQMGKVVANPASDVDLTHARTIGELSAEYAKLSEKYKAALAKLQTKQPNVQLKEKLKKQALVRTQDHALPFKVKEIISRVTGHLMGAKVKGVWYFQEPNHEFKTYFLVERPLTNKELFFGVPSDRGASPDKLNLNIQRLTLNVDDDGNFIDHKSIHAARVAGPVVRSHDAVTSLLNTMQKTLQNSKEQREMFNDLAVQVNADSKELQAIKTDHTSNVAALTQKVIELKKREENLKEKLLQLDNQKTAAPDKLDKIPDKRPQQPEAAQPEPQPGDIKLDPSGPRPPRKKHLKQKEEEPEEEPEESEEDDLDDMQGEGIIDGQPA